MPISAEKLRDGTLPVNTLRAFDSAARHSSFAVAAADLCITPSALSLQIRQLELALGVKLFTRTGRSVKLTRSGRQLAPSTSLGIEFIDDAANSLLTNLSKSDIIVFCPSSIAALWLCPRMRRYMDANPGQRFRFYGNFPNPSYPDLDIDIYIVPSSPAWGGLPLSLEPLIPGRVQYSLPLISPGKWRELKMAQGMSLLKQARLIQDASPQVNSISDFRTWLDAAGYTEIDANKVNTLATGELVLRTAAAGGGIAYGRSVFFMDFVHSGQLAAPFDLAVHSDRGVFLGYRREKMKRRNLRDFVNWIRGEGEKDAEAIDRFMQGKKIVELEDWEIANAQ